MFDTMTGVKIVGGFCGAFLVFLLGSWVGEIIYHGGGGHGEEHQAYTIPVEDGGDGGEEEGEEVAFADVYAEADAGAGERLFRQCSACHKLEDGANATGPHLYQVVGRDIGGVSGYEYSDALAGSDQAWSPENLDGFIADPSGWAPGTKMTYNGLGDIEDRANLIAYLEAGGS